MQFINYFFASLISFSGLFIGIILMNIAPEEKKTLEKYFSFLRKIFLLLIFIFLFFYYYNNYFNFVFVIIVFLLSLFFEFKIKNLLKKSAISYVILSILFFLSSKNINLFVIVSSLILLYGLPTASLTYNRKEKNYSKIISYNIGFIIIANLLFLLPFFIPYF